MEQWQQMKEIFGDALKLAPESRPLFLDKVCGNDKSLRREVESLLTSLENDSGFMEWAAIGIVADMFGETENKMPISKRFNQYEIIRKIGAGGMGEVYLAKDTKLDRQVAIKILSEKFAQHESNLQRFVKEAKSASSLNHPNILVIHEIGEQNKIHYIVSEYIEGKTLRQILNEKTLQLPQVFEIALQIANALCAAHSARIVHRDIKPENIIVRPDGYVKILDFGLAKLVEQKAIGSKELTLKQNETAKGLIMGTVQYMSPEQAKGDKIDERSDIFSFGVVLYEMIAGRTPFAANSMPETFANLINKEPPPLSHFVPDVSPKLEQIVLKMLVKNKNERYQTIQDLPTYLKGLQRTVEINNVPENDSTPLNAKTIQHIELKIQDSPSEIRNSIAVLPFINISSDAENEYFCDGLAEELLNALSKVENLKVVARTSSFSFKGKNVDVSEIAEKLNVQKVIEGSVRKFGSRMRISIQIINVEDSCQIWSERYDLEMKDIFDIQDEITLAVIDSLKINIHNSEKYGLLKRYVGNVEAYEYFLKANYYFEKRNLINTPEIALAIEFFKKAIEVDPNYALAHASLGYAYTWKAVYNDADNPRWIELARQHLDIAESANPKLPRIYEARNQILWSKYNNWDIPAAVRGVLSERKLNPHLGHLEMGIFAFHLGMEDITVNEFALAKELDPSSDFLKFATVYGYSLIGRYDEGIEIGHPYGCDANGYTHCLLWKNRLEEAEAALNEALERIPNHPLRQGEKVLLLALKGKFEESEALIDKIRKQLPISQIYHHVTYDFACAFALNGKVSESIKWLKETFDNGMPHYPLFETDPHLNNIRQAPEFIEYMKSIKPKWEEIKQVFDDLWLNPVNIN